MTPEQAEKVQAMSAWERARKFWPMLHEGRITKDQYDTILRIPFIKTVKQGDEICPDNREPRNNGMLNRLPHEDGQCGGETDKTVGEESRRPHMERPHQYPSSNNPNGATGGLLEEKDTAFEQIIKNISSG